MRLQPRLRSTCSASASVRQVLSSGSGDSAPTVVQPNQVNFTYTDAFGIQQKGQFVGLGGPIPNCVISTTTAPQAAFGAALADSVSRVELDVAATGGSTVFTHFHDVVEKAQNGHGVTDADLNSISFPNSTLTARFATNPAVYTSSACKVKVKQLVTMTHLGGAVTQSTGLLYSANCPLMVASNINSQIVDATVDFACVVEESTQN